MKISGNFQPTRWDEKPYGAIEDGKKATKISADFTFSGDIKGVAHVQYLMFYKSFDTEDQHNSVAQHVGLVRISGMLKGKSGGFAMTDLGSYEPGVAKSIWTVIQGSGTGEFSRITGTGGYKADRSGGRWEMDVEL